MSFVAKASSVKTPRPVALPK